MLFHRYATQTTENVMKEKKTNCNISYEILVLLIKKNYIDVVYFSFIRIVQYDYDKNRC